MQTDVTSTKSNGPVHDVLIVGAGFAGLYALHRFRSMGLTCRVIEAGSDVGGTWYWNRYPGARCDVESMQYSYSFSEELQQEWNWTERYASQPEILAYAGHVADRFGLRSGITFNTRVLSLRFDEERGVWTGETDAAEQVAARFCVLATGCLSVPRLPDLEGLDTFGGKIYQTSQWPHQPVRFHGLRVGVVGTGSSGMQVIPEIAREAAFLTVFQRTANFSIPARNSPLTQEEIRRWKSQYPRLRAEARRMQTGTLRKTDSRSALEVPRDERETIYEERWQQGGAPFIASFSDLLRNAAANETAAEFVRRKIAAIVRDPARAEDLTPHGFPIGTKRICVDTNYFDTFNRDNVTLVNLRKERLERISPTGLVTSRREIGLDAIVFATGFDAITGPIMNIDIRGRGGVSLRSEWQDGPRTYLGLMTHGFPNLFTVTGPGSPSVISNMIVSIEQHVDWIADCLRDLAQRQVSTIEAGRAAQDDWVVHVNEAAEATLFPAADSWYLGANVPGKPRVFMPYLAGVGAYRDICDRVRAAGYAGFMLDAAPARPLPPA